MIYTGENALHWKKLRNKSIVLAAVSLGLSILVHPFFLFVTIVAIIFARYCTNKFDRWATGFEGEYLVIEEFSKINCLTGVLLSDLILPNMHSNIDHVLICDRGIFALETKTYSGIYYAEGDKWYYKTKYGEIMPIKSLSRLAKRNAAILSKFLERKYGEHYFITPIVVFAGPTIFEGKSTIPVLFPSQIKFYLCALPRTLSNKDIARLSDLLIKYSRHVMEVGTNAS
ncbi:nuclease-related domain-containing protein [Thermococcus sp. MAR1]|uniref:nuclease-related domain-containing protein n=1 Tax=Thermococcus sp. MAR1 TaxID=1638263 RepID=UPI00143C0C2D|nr:nuclease-related domain-containing protein [Thermococcus sp. MAR1]NJE09494.1 NERD domain-containing protein [Thermococcus sp. MAR1]